MEWISVKDRPLFQKLNKELGEEYWQLTTDGEGHFMAAIQYRDGTKPNEDQWWIHHCCVEDEIGLCVIGDDGNESAGWGIEDIDFWMKIEEPKF